MFAARKLYRGGYWGSCKRVLEANCNGEHESKEEAISERYEA